VVYPAVHGSRLLVPAEYDILVSFAPAATDDDRTQIGGNFKITAFVKEQIELSDWKEGHFVNVLRPGEIDFFPQPEVIIEEEPEPEEEEEQQ